MPDLINPDKTIPAMTKMAIDRVCQLEEVSLKRPQVNISTEHMMHAGVYARTICIPKGVMLTGALIKIATVLIVSGDAVAHIGEKSIRLTGYNVFAASAHRKQAFVALQDTHLTMVFSSSANDVKQAESEFTDDHEKLFSNLPDAKNVIKGEKCQVE